MFQDLIQFVLQILGMCIAERSKIQSVHVGCALLAAWDGRKLMFIANKS